MELDIFYEKIKKRLANNKKQLFCIEGEPQEGQSIMAIKLTELTNKMVK